MSKLVIRFTMFTRLMLGFAAVLVPVLILGSVIVWELNRIQNTTRAAATEDTAILRTTDQLIETLLTQEGFERKFVVAGDVDFLVQFRGLDKTFLSGLSELRTLVVEPEQRKWFEKADARYLEYAGLVDREGALIAGGKTYDAEGLRSQKDRLIEAVSGALMQLSKDVAAAREIKISDSSRRSALLFKLTAVLGAAVIVLGVLIAFWTTRTVNRSVIKLRNRVRAYTEGNFQCIDDIYSPAEIAQLAEDFNHMGTHLMEVDRMKADFISQISHELRTPLTSIKESASMLHEGIFRAKPEKERALLEIIRVECERLIESVSALLDLSRMEAGMMTYEFLDGNLEDLLHQWVGKLWPIADRKKIDMTVDMKRPLPMVQMDASRIGQVLQNLIGNALKFTPEGGKVWISAGPVSNGGDCVRIDVSDTGCGISPEETEIIFDKFSTGNERKDFNSTGLGLSIAKHIVAAHGGDIWAQSETDTGCTFSFTLPLSSASS